MKAFVKIQTIRGFIICSREPLISTLIWMMDWKFEIASYFLVKVLIAKIWSLGTGYGPLSYIRLLLGMIKITKIKGVFGLCFQTTISSF